MFKTDGRDINSTVVWWESEQGKASITSYVVNTKSKGKKVVLALTNYPGLADMGVTKDDDKFKSALLKVYDFTKVGTDKNGKFIYISFSFIDIYQFILNFQISGWTSVQHLPSAGSGQGTSSPT